MEEQIIAAMKMVQVHSKTNTMLEAVGVVEEMCPEVSREQLMLIWVGVNAAQMSEIKIQKKAP
ncbi:hypothetical protein [uncultured Shewanella sp.]|uniref:hypothetical protein n=1 Tax=uncultured Shewanella sp. TaxID=173975 RepID=UPI0026038C18|nr:hypothetical protein [uncultured Shewanella sp.]